MRITYLLLLLFIPFIGFAQLDTDDSHVNLYFPTVLDGGPPAGQWQTVFTFANPGATTATIILYLQANDGSGLALDLGSGTGTKWRISVPAYGVRAVPTRAISGNVQSGWAYGYSNVPVRATALLRQLISGNMRYEVNSESTLPSIGFMMPAQKNALISIANVYDSLEETFVLTLRNSDGKQVGQQAYKLPASNRVMFALADVFALADGFTGTLQIEGATAKDIFVVGGLGRDSANNYIPLRPGKYTFPIAHWDRIWLVFQKVIDVARPLIPDVDTIELNIDYSTTLNAFAKGGKSVTITMALAELISDSPSELAYVVAHEVGHIYQQRTGKVDFVSDNREFDADMWGLLLSLSAGYDPYAGAGALAKLAMATGTAGLATQFEEQSADDAHKSFNSRLDLMYGFVQLTCNYSNETQAACNLYKSIIHPHFPDSVPLAVPPRQPAAMRVPAKDVLPAIE